MLIEQICRRKCRLPLQELLSSLHPLEEGAIGCAVFDDGVYGARHLGRDRCIGLATQMRIMFIIRNEALELVPKAVGPL